MYPYRHFAVEAVFAFVFEVIAFIFYSVMELRIMRRAVSLLFALVLCFTLAGTALAAEDGFVPSITYKPNPELMPVVGEDGKEYIGVVRDASGKIISYVDYGCLRITPIAHVWDEEIEVPEEIEELLLFVYNGLNDGSMKIPYDKHEADLDPANMVIRDLFDARWYCEEHPLMLEPEGVVLELTFDLGVVADAQIFTQTYDEEKAEWHPIVKTVNNGDGTVTCTFEHLCAVQFSMPLVTAPAAADSAQKPLVWPWIALLAAAAGGTGTVVAVKKKKKTVV